MGEEDKDREEREERMTRRLERRGGEAGGKSRVGKWWGKKASSNYLKRTE